jgi:hypothetical protein
MNHCRNLACALSAVLALSLLPTFAGLVRAADEFGTVTGQFVLEGDLPAPKVLIAQGAEVKDAAVCAKDAVPAEDLVVDEKTKGIANIFVYIYYKDAQNLPVHPDLKASKKKEVVFDQKGCRFIPHALLVRTDQMVLVKSDDAIAHNTHTNTIFNQPVNFLLAPNDRTGIPVDVKRPESLPLPVQCDIHPWMKAYWLVVDHPYAAVTDKEGRFTIENLPVGEHEFRVWHERVGYLDRKYKIKVEAGKKEAQPLPAVPVPAAKFAEK